MDSVEKDRINGKRNGILNNEYRVQRGELLAKKYKPHSFLEE